MKPDFIGIGGGRSGTSWIYYSLYDHPQLCLPFKEITFFSRDDHFSRGFEWYENHFRTCSSGKLVGEMSVYLNSLEAPKRIFDYHPDVKLFVSLRNPVDRAFSSYQNEIKAGIIDSKTPFEEAITRRPLYIERSLYSDAIKRYWGYFKRSQLLVLIYEDALRDPEGFIRKIYEYLGVDPTFHPAMIRDRVNLGGVLRSVRLDLAMDSLAATLRRRGMQRVIWTFKRLGVIGFVRRANIRSRATPMTPEQKTQLQELFTPDIKELEGLLQRDLSMWLDDGQSSGQEEYREESLPPAKQG